MKDEAIGLTTAKETAAKIQLNYSQHNTEVKIRPLES
jgi:hypothetical protein